MAWARSESRKCQKHMQNTSWNRISKSSCNKKLMTIKAHSSNLIFHQGLLHLPDSESSGEQNAIHQCPHVLGSSVPSHTYIKWQAMKSQQRLPRFIFPSHFCKEDRGKAITAQNPIEIECNRIENSVSSLSFPLKMWELEMLCLHSI